MRFQPILLGALGALALSACSQKEDVAMAPPPPPGAVPGSVAADRDGDGIIDGYYTADGIYHPNYVPPPPPPPPASSSSPRDACPPAPARPWSRSAGHVPDRPAPGPSP